MMNPASVVVTAVALVGCVLLAGCTGQSGASSGASGATPTETTATGAPMVSPGDAAIASPSTGADGLRVYEVSIEGRIVLLPFDVALDPRSMPSADVGETVGRFERDGRLVIEDVTTVSADAETRQPELALESGDFVREIADPVVGTIQIVTNYAMWSHTTNGPRAEADFPTHIFELERGVDGSDLAYYVHPNVLGPAFILESIDNLFVSHDSPNRALRIVRVGSITIRFEEGGAKIRGEIDLVGRVRTGGAIIGDPDEVANYRYLAAFEGALEN